MAEENQQQEDIVLWNQEAILTENDRYLLEFVESLLKSNRKLDATPANQRPSSSFFYRIAIQLDTKSPLEGQSEEETSWGEISNKNIEFFKSYCEKPQIQIQEGSMKYQSSATIEALQVLKCIRFVDKDQIVNNFAIVEDSSNSEIAFYPDSQIYLIVASKSLEKGTLITLNKNQVEQITGIAPPLTTNAIQIMEEKVDNKDQELLDLFSNNDIGLYAKIDYTPLKVVRQIMIHKYPEWRDRIVSRKNSVKLSRIPIGLDWENYFCCVATKMTPENLAIGCYMAGIRLDSEAYLNILETKDWISLFFVHAIDNDHQTILVSESFQRNGTDFFLTYPLKFDQIGTNGIYYIFPNITMCVPNKLVISVFPQKEKKPPKKKSTESAKDWSWFTSSFSNWNITDDWLPFDNYLEHLWEWGFSEKMYQDNAYGNDYLSQFWNRVRQADHQLAFSSIPSTWKSQYEALKQKFPSFKSYLKNSQQGIPTLEKQIYKHWKHMLYPSEHARKPMFSRQMAGLINQYIVKDLGPIPDSVIPFTLPYRYIIIRTALVLENKYNSTQLESIERQYGSSYITAASPWFPM